MPWVMPCPAGHLHLAVPCPCGCGRLVPTTWVRARLVLPGLTMTNVHVENSVESPFNIGGDGLVVGRNVTCKNSPTPFNIDDGVVLDLDGVDYESPGYRPPRRERRKRKR